MTDISPTLQTGRPQEQSSRPRLRFAVGAFDTWQHLRNALRDLELRGLVLGSFNCLALREVFAGRIIIGPSGQSVDLVSLAFPHHAAPLCCTSGPLAECLVERLRTGARTLGDALTHWLLPRHAAHLEDMVLTKRILFWIALADSEAERLAYETLLAYSSNTVGVHDLC